MKLNKKSLLITTIFSVGTLILLIVFSYYFVNNPAGAATTNKYCPEGAKQYSDFQPIQEYMSCQSGHCEGTGKILFNFYGPKADCEKNDLKCKKNYLYGNSGTLVISGNLTINGSRLYLNGYDSTGFHWINTGLEEPDSSAIGFKRKTRDTYFGSNVYPKGDLIMDNKNNGIYFGSLKSPYVSIVNMSNTGIMFNANSGATIMRLFNEGEYRVSVDNGLNIDGTLWVNGKITIYDKEIRYANICDRNEVCHQVLYYE